MLAMLAMRAMVVYAVFREENGVFPAKTAKLLRASFSFRNAKVGSSTLLGSTSNHLQQPISVASLTPVSGHSQR